MRIFSVNAASASSFVNFKSGHTSIYSDFDGTYMPYAHYDVCSGDMFINDRYQRERFCDLYSKFKKFISNGKKELSFTLTTGRTKPEYDYIENKIIEKNLDYYKPQTLITSNGNDKYLRNSDGEWVLDDNRNLAIKSNCNFSDRKQIVTDLKNILKSQVKNVLIIDTKVNKCEADYGQDSLEYAIRKLYSGRSKNIAAFVADENFRFDISFSPDVDIHKVANAFQKYFDDRNMHLKVDYNSFDEYNPIPVYYSKNDYELKPAVTMSIEPMLNSKRLTKLYDIKNEVRRIVEGKTNDLVIAAGDGDNDLDMLNPLNYLDLYGIKADADIRILLQREEVRKALKDLPFFAVVVGHHSCMDGLRRIGRILEEFGIHKMIFTNDDRAGILYGVKSAMKDYGNVNPDYLYSMNFELYKDVVGG